MDRLTRLAAAAVIAALLFVAARPAQAQDVAVPSAPAPAVAAPNATLALDPVAVALSADLVALRRERASIDFTGAHVLVAMGGVLLSVWLGVGLLGLLVQAIEAIASTDTSGPNPLLVGSGIGALGGLALLGTGAVWAAALSGQQSSVDARIAGILSCGARLGLAPTDGGFVASVSGNL